jgi:hypothetical protein
VSSPAAYSPPDGEPNPLIALLRQCVVRVDDQVGRFRGTGFFLAPGLVVTCAHVVHGATGLRVNWQDRAVSATVAGAVPAPESVPDSAVYPLPDLAVLQVEGANAWGHPCVSLGGGRPAGGRSPDVLYLAGYTVEHGPNTALTGVTIWFESPVSQDGHELYKLRRGQVLPGLAGSPLLNLRTGLVAAILESSRSLRDDLGGFAVPAAEIATAFPDAAAASQRFHAADSRWASAARAEREPAAAGSRAGAEAEIPAPATPAEQADMSSSVRAVLSRAVGLASERPVDASFVLLAALLHAHETSLPGMTSALLNSLTNAQPETTRDPGEMLDRLADALGVKMTDLRASDDEVARQVAAEPLTLLLMSAAEIALRVSGHRDIHLRHLVAAAVLADRPPLQAPALADLGVTLADLRQFLREAVLAETSGEPAAAWHDLIPSERTASTRLAGGIDSDRVDPTCGIPIERDHLDVGVWVSMLATAIVSADTQMPLSVGIFGKWGAGKSYFMGLLRSEIERLSGSGRESYLKDVVQIGFNAWHYADTNLWASLGDEIFRQLAGPGEMPDHRRKMLREKIAATTSERVALEARKDHARKETERLQSELEEAAARRDIGAKDLLHAIMSSRTLRDELSKVWRRLGISDEMQQARLLADEVRGTANEAVAMRRQFGRRRSWLLAIVSAVAVLVIIAAAWIPASWSRWLSGGGATALAVSLSIGVTWAATAKRALTQLRTITTEVNKSLEASAEEHTRKAVGEAIAELRRAEADKKVAQAQLDELVARVGQLTRELSDLMPSQQLYTFIAERAGSGMYAGQLGLISTIRKDFERLVELLRDWHAHGAGEHAQRPIDRIVLYIDDLDRCPSNQVVDVLQAMHLLLALDLFVVVVGVDPRWLRRSLQHRYQDIFRPDAALGPGHVLPEVTPDDYLEKIFNVPIVLPGIPPAGLGRMLRGLAAANSEQRPAAAPPVVGPPSPAQPAARGTGRESLRAEPATLPVETDSELASPETAEPPQPLTEPELTILSGLHPFVGTPRDAKRMLNLYRMLRSTRRLADASSFLGDGGPGEYEAVAMLLGMLAADARLLGKVINAPLQDDPQLAGGLIYRPNKGQWHDFVSDFAPVDTVGTWSNQIIGPIPPGQIPAWQHFAASAAQTRHLISLPDLSAFKRWAPIIQRFSFQISPSWSSLTLPVDSSPKGTQAVSAEVRRPHRDD